MKIGFALKGTLALAAASLSFAATPQGDFVLVEEGLAGAGTQNYAVLATLTLDGAGNVKGTEVVRVSNVNLVADVKGTYVMSSANSGTMRLSAVDASDTEATPVIQTYRFLVTKSGEMRAIRTDAGVLSVSAISPALAEPNTGSFALNELGRNDTLLAELTRDGNGALSGSARAFGASRETSPTVSGSYTAPAKGLGTLTVRLMTKDEDGNEVTETRNYRTAATADGVHVIRMDPGTVSMATMEVL